MSSSEFDFDAEANQPFRDAYEAGLPWVRASRIVKSVLTDCYSANPELTIAYLRSLVPRVCEELSRGGSIDPFVPEIHRRVIELRQPIRVPSKDEQIVTIAPVLTGRDGWAGIEIDLLRDVLSDGEKIVGYDRRKVTTEARVITRLSLRERRPVNWTNLRTWNDQFPEVE